MAHHLDVVFDLGGVLIDWDPRYLYRQLLDDEDEIERFLDEVCTHAWNEEQDAGRSFDDAVALLSARHPEHAPLIAAYRDRWPEMLGGPLADTVRVLDDVRARQPVYALTNWSAETFPHATARYAFLEWFAGIVVSGHEGVKKPDPAIFEVLLARFGLAPARTVFIDDSARNVDAAAALGFDALRFTDATALRRALTERGVLDDGAR